MREGSGRDVRQAHKSLEYDAMIRARPRIERKALQLIRRNGLHPVAAQSPQEFGFNGGYGCDWTGMIARHSSAERIIQA